MAGIDLGLDLRAVAPVDEHARDVLQRDAEARRTGEARQPRQPIVTGGHVFALVRVGAGHEEASQPFSDHRLAQGGEAGRALFRAGGVLEGLEHGRPPGDCVSLTLLREGQGKINAVIPCRHGARMERCGI